MSEPSEAHIPPARLPRVWGELDRGLVLLTKLSVALIGVGFVVLISSEVVSRFFFDRSAAGANATSRILLVWFFMLGAGLALRQGAHVGVDALYARLPPAAARGVAIVAQFLILAFFLQMLWGSYLAFTASLRQFEGTLSISLGWVMAAFPVGFGLLIYHWLVLNVDRMRSETRR